MTQAEPKIGRAAPMSPEDRRAAIIDAVIPLVLERGRDITSRQIADAAGVAEGTIFRAFGDKDSVIEAAVETFLDSGRFRAAISAIDIEAPLEEKVAALVVHLRARLTGMMGIMTALGKDRRAAGPPRWRHYVEIVERMLQPDAERLRVSAADAAHLIRVVVFGASIGRFNQERPFETDELVDFVVNGITVKET